MLGERPIFNIEDHEDRLYITVKADTLREKNWWKYFYVKKEHIRKPAYKSFFTKDNNDLSHDDII